MIKIILAHSSLSPSRVKKAFPGAGWIYFGKDYLSRRRWDAQMASGSKVAYKKELTAISYDLRDEYVKWSAELGRPHWQKPEWWITTIVTRNTVCSALYQCICYLEVLKLLSEKYEGPLVVVFENHDLASAIITNFKNRFPVVFAFHLEYRILQIFERIKTLALFVFCWIAYFKNSVYEFLSSRISRISGHPKKEFVFDKNHVVVHTCIDDGCIGDNGQFQDRYFPKLCETLEGCGNKVSTLVWLYNIKKMNAVKAFSWFRRNKRSFLIPQDYYNLNDCLRSFAFVLRSSRLCFEERSRQFRGMDLTQLIDAEQRSQSRNIWTAYFVNQTAMFKQWKRCGYGLKGYVDIWELKTCEVPAIMGIKANYPACRTISYQHSGLIPKLLMFNYKTTREEFNASPHADLGIVNGFLTREFLLKEGFPSEFVRLGPALRYMWLKDKQPVPIDSRDILVCLSLSADINRELIETVYSALSSSEYTVWIKPHPMMDIDKFRQSLSFPWPDNFRIAEGEIEKWILFARAVVVSQSSSMVDSFYLGIRTIVVACETDIDIIPLDVIGENNLWEVVHSPEDLARAVKKPVDDNVSGREELRSKLFEFDMGLLKNIF